MSHFHTSVRLLFVVTALLLAACGGGDSGDDGQATFSLSTTSISFKAATNSATPASQEVDVTASGGTVYIEIINSGTGFDATFRITGQTTGAITVAPSYPSMAPGQYQGTITVRGCSTTDCSSGEVAGSPKTINVTYNVTWPSGSVGSSCVGSTSSDGRPGSPDTSFCGTGLSLYDSIFKAYGDDDGRDIAIDANGRILVAGYTLNVDGNWDIALWRYLASGAVDTSFGTNFDSKGPKEGFVTYDGGVGSFRNDIAEAIAFDADGRILVAGETANGNSTTDMIVLRYSSSGVLDTTFANGGKFIHNGAAGGNSADTARGMVVDASGNIIIAGYSVNAAGNYDMVIWRLLSTGVLDTTFGGDYNGDTIKDGFVKHHNAAGGDANDHGIAMVVDSAGRILVAGSSTKLVTSPTNDIDMLVWRFTANGVLDTTFGGDYNADSIADGFFKHDGATIPGNYDSASSIALDSSGRIIVGGSSFNATANYDMVVWRLTPDGALDTTFGGDYDSNGTKDGFALYGENSSWEFARAVRVDSHDRIVVAGVSSNDLLVARYTSDGSFDTSFGASGVKIFGYLPYAGLARAMVLDPSDKILITGSVNTGATAAYDMAIWRLLP